MEHSFSRGGARAAARRALRTAVSAVTVVALAASSATPAAASRPFSIPFSSPSAGSPAVCSPAAEPVAPLATHASDAHRLAADAAAPTRSTVRYSDPLTGGRTPSRVTRGFDPPAHDWLPGHRGVDLAAAPGTPVLAAAAGTVAFAGQVAGTPVVSIDHADGLRTTYQPVRASVRRGQEVAGGERIGVLVATTPGRDQAGDGSEGGRSDGAGPGDSDGSVGDQAHDGLHWGARPIDSPTAYVDPLALLEAAVIRLKPLRPGDGPAGRRA